MGFSHSDKCQHCPALTDNYYHAFWNCPPTQQFWSEVMDRLSEILGLVIPLCPIVALLNDISSLSAPNHLKSFILSFTIAEKVILLNWKDRTKIKHWLTDHCNWETFIANFKNNTKPFKEIWSQFLQYYISGTSSEFANILHTRCIVSNCCGSKKLNATGLEFEVANVALA